jgi:hypothetical protein
VSSRSRCASATNLTVRIPLSYADGIIAQEFADAVLQVIGKTPDDEGALEMKERCARYAKIAKAQGGRERVAREIVELAQRNERE